MLFMPLPLPPIKHRDAYKSAGRTSKITYFLTEYATSKYLYFFVTRTVLSVMHYRVFFPSVAGRCLIQFRQIISLLFLRVALFSHGQH